MAYQPIDIGTVADDDTGNNLRDGGDKINDNFLELYTALGDGSTLTAGLTAYTSTDSTKLGTIEDSADVTDATNVAAAGAAMVSGNVPADNNVAVWTSATGLEGSSGLIYNGSTFGVTGNITVTGTVDGRDIATDGGTLDTIAGTNYETSIANIATATNGASGIASGSIGDLDAFPVYDNSAGGGDKVTFGNLSVWLGNKISMGQSEAEAGNATTPRTITAEVLAAAIAARAPSADIRGKFIAYNDSGGVLAGGVPVYASGEDATSGYVEITTATANGSGTMPCVGIVDVDISNAASGDVIQTGVVTGQNTAAFTVGDALYVQDNGTLSNSPPTGATSLVQEVARVTRVDASNGEILVNIQESAATLADGNSQDDVNGNEIIGYSVAASAVNQIDIGNAATGSGPTIAAAGDDTNIDLNITPKGSGAVVLDGLSWPTADGTNGQVVTTDGAGNLSFTTGSGGAAQLSDLSDVNTSTATNRNVLVADGVDWESRALVEADISDLGSYTTASSTDTLTNKTIDTANNTLTVAVADITADTLANWNAKLTGNSFVGTAAAQTLSDKTLTEPKFVDGGFIADANGAEQVIFSTTASAVNEMTVTNAATGGAPSIAATGGDTDIDLTLSAKGDGVVKGALVPLAFAIGSETDDATTGTAKLTYYMPRAFTIVEIHACVTTAPTGASMIIDVNDGGTSIMTTNKLEIDVSENDTSTAATAPTLTDTAIAAGAALTFDIDQIGSTVAGAGPKVTLLGYWT